MKESKGTNIIKSLSAFITVTMYLKKVEIVLTVIQWKISTYLQFVPFANLQTSLRLTFIFSFAFSFCKGVVLMVGELDKTLLVSWCQIPCSKILYWSGLHMYNFEADTGFPDLSDLWVIKIKKPVIPCACSTWWSREQSTKHQHYRSKILE